MEMRSVAECGWVEIEALFPVLATMKQSDIAYIELASLYVLSHLYTSIIND